MRAFMKRRLGVSASALLMACASCGGGRSADEGSGTADPVVPVRVAALEVRTFREEVAAPGQWRVTNELVVTAPFAAFVESLRVDIGDPVLQGVRLGTLVTRESRAAVLGAEQLLAAASDPAARAEAERALRQARRDLVRVPLVANAGGILVRRGVSPGADVAEGVELMAIVSPQAMVFEAHVPVRDVGRVAIGQSARVDMEDGTALDATVRRRLPQTSTSDQSALVWLSPSRPPPAELLDRFGSAAIATGAPRRALAVPDSALVEDDLTGESRIACVGRDDLATWVPVRLGLGEGGWHQLLAPPLVPGTRAIVSGQRGLPDSTHVTIEP